MKPAHMVVALVLMLVLAVPGCTSAPVAEREPDAPVGGDGAEIPATPPAEESPSDLAWLDTPLTDAVTGEQFRLTDYKGTPVLLHAFAVW